MLKPSFDEYMYWTQVVIDRLNTALQVYKNPPHVDVFISEAERQQKLSETACVLRDLHAMTDDSELKAAHPNEASDDSENRIIDNLFPLFTDVLDRLPDWSQDMQKLLKSPWYENCSGKMAHDLFCGPNGHEAEGIGSGLSIHGRLPAQLEAMMEREQMGDDRAPREAIPQKIVRTMNRSDLAKRWGQRNGAFLRSAGRID